MSSMKGFDLSGVRATKIIGRVRFNLVLADALPKVIEEIKK